MQNRKTIAILDDGVSARSFLQMRFQLEVQGGRVQPVRYDGRARGHGSLCAHILQKLVPEAALGSVCVVDGPSGRGKTADLLIALDWCIDNGIRLVNLSMGSSYPSDRQALEEAANRAAKAGVLLIAANSNEGSCAWPACCKNAIGVEADPHLEAGLFLRHPQPEKGIDFLAGSAHALKIDSSPFVTPISNSFAAPVVTAAAWRCLQENGKLTLENLRKALENMAQ